MIQPTKWEKAPQYQRQLVSKYEELRALVLEDKESPSNDPLGCSILLFRGMAVWIETCLAGEETDALHTVHSHLQPTHNVTRNDCLQFDALSDPTRTEATKILTNMVMGHQEIRSCNV